MEELKPCPNCGSTDFEAEGTRPDSLVFCGCGEERPLEEWQCDTAREKILRAENAELKRKVAQIVKLEKLVAADIAKVDEDKAYAASMYEMGVRDGIRSTLEGVLEQLGIVLRDAGEGKE